jgi:predicted nucleic acid-binding protein
VRTAVDTNILSALWSAEPLASEAVKLLGEAHRVGGLVICGAVYCELLAHPKASPKFVDQFLRDTNIAVDFVLEEPVWQAAGRAFAEYAERRRISGGGVAKRLLVDFLVGAHAHLGADQLLTLDPGRYSQAFPSLQISPQA